MTNVLSLETQRLLRRQRELRKETLASEPPDLPDDHTALEEAWSAERDLLLSVLNHPVSHPLRASLDDWILQRASELLLPLMTEYLASLLPSLPYSPDPYSDSE